MSRVWLITGCSGGFGAALANAALEAGERVVATFRNPAQAQAFEEAAADTFGPGRGAAIVLDITNEQQIEGGAKAAQAAFGKLDVLVNNAGIGEFGPLEIMPVQNIREQFETNLFGPLRLTQHVLPGMRDQGSGLIVQMSSVSGHVGLPGLGAYAAAKFALEGLSDSLAAEVAEFGIGVMVVAPGPFRTSWVGASKTRSSKDPDVGPYATGAAANQIGRLHALDGQQPGDPARAAKLIVDASRQAPPPRRLIIGDVAMQRVQERMDALKSDIDAWRERSAATAFDV